MNFDQMSVKLKPSFDYLRMVHPEIVHYYDNLTATRIDNQFPEELMESLVGEAPVVTHESQFSTVSY